MQFINISIRPRLHKWICATEHLFFIKKISTFNFPPHVLPKAVICSCVQPTSMDSNYVQSCELFFRLFRYPATMSYCYCFSCLWIGGLLAMNTQWEISLRVAVYCSAWPKEEIWLHVYGISTMAEGYWCLLWQLTHMLLSRFLKIQYVFFFLEFSSLSVVMYFLYVLGTYLELYIDFFYLYMMSSCQNWMKL